MSEKLCIIIAAGGSSRRYGETDKLLEMLDGLPVLLHSIRNFAPLAAPGALVVAAGRDNLALYSSLAEKYLPEISVKWVCGGETRAGSVRNALAALPENTAMDSLVAIHDAARPLADAALLLKVSGRAREVGGAIAAVKVVDTLKSSDDGELIARTVDRSKLWRAETPQVFVLGNYLAAYNQDGVAELTDDAEIMRRAGFPVALVESGIYNGKLTSPGDLEQLKCFCNKRC